MGVVSSPSPITDNSVAQFNINCRPCVVNLKNTGAGSVTVQILAGSPNILKEYNPSKVLAPGESVQQAIEEPHQVVGIATTANTGALMVEITAAGF